MKKIAIFFLIIIIIIVGISYLYLNYKISYNRTKKDNLEYEEYYNKEIYGAELTTIINKAMDNNSYNKVEKDKKGKYIDDGKNSVNIEIKMLDNDETYNMETFYNGGMDNFVKYYNQIKFRCVKIEYHESTKKVKYMLFEQITQ